mmetsp:Transcript_7118/g.14402  ORF Transcript_7118/g.14402 Transcript_7118/m.14402 type:complete len:1078 (+) Transcript_7118:324-3557(+)
MHQPTDLLPVLVLVIGHLLAARDLGSPDLGPLLLLLAREHLLGRLHLDRVAEGIHHLLHRLELHLLAGDVLHPLGVTLAVQVADAVLLPLQHPRLGAQLGAEVVVVGDHHHAALEVLDGGGERAERLAVEVVGGLVQDDDVRLVPQGGGKHHLHLLPAGQGGHAMVAAELAVQAHVLQMLLHVHLGQGALVGALAHRHLLVHQLAVLLEADLLQLGLGHVGVALVTDALPGHLVEVLLRLLVILAGAGEAVDDALDLDGVALGVHAVNLHGQLAHLLLLLGEGHGHLLGRLAVLTVLVAPADVLVGGLGQVLLNVVEGVLRHVRHAGVGVLPHGTLGGVHLAGQQLDHGGLAGTVDADARHAGGQGHLHGDVCDGGLVVDGVGELALRHLHQRLALGLDALDEAGLGEVEGELGGLQLEVRLGVGVRRHEAGQVALGSVELEVLDLQNVGAALVQQLGVVGHDDGGHVLEGVDVVHGPLHVEHVQMVGGLVHEQNVGLLKHSAGKRKLHAPATGKEGHGLADHLLGEADGGQHSLDLIAGDVGRFDLYIRENVVNAGQVGQVAENVSLHEHGAELGAGGEALHLLVSDGAHESGLAGIVATKETIAFTTEQLHLSVVQQNLGAVGESELAVAQLLGILLLLDLDLGGEIDDALLVHCLEGSIDSGPVTERREVALDVLLPGLAVVLVGVAQGADNVGGEVDGLLQVGIDRACEVLLHVTGDGGVVSLLALVGLHLLLNAAQLLERLLAHIAGLGVGHLHAGLVQGGQQLGQEGSGLHRVLHKLGHVRHNLRALALDGGVLLLETAGQQGHNNGQGGALDGLDEGARRQGVDGLGHLGDVGHRLDDGRDHLLNILVANGDAALLHGHLGLHLHGLSDVHHAGGHHGDDFGEALGHLGRVGLSQLLQGAEGTNDSRGAARVVHGLQQLRHDGLGRVSGQGADGAGARGLSRLAHGLLLVSAQLQHSGKHRHDEGIASRANVLGDGAEGSQGGSALGALLLVSVLHDGDQLLDRVIVEGGNPLRLDKGSELSHSRSVVLGGVDDLRNNSRSHVWCPYRQKVETATAVIKLALRQACVWKW